MMVDALTGAGSVPVPVPSTSTIVASPDVEMGGTSPNTSSMPTQLMPGSSPASQNAEQPKVTGVRGTTVKLSVPLDDPVSAPSLGSGRSGTTTTVHGTRKLLRRDSLDRREALLKGKEGSRQRRRWENDRLLSNPHAEPPLPSDWEVRPTYPRRTIPYYLAPLWDAAEFQRAIEAKLKASRRNSTRKRRSGKNSSSRGSNVYETGMSPMEEIASNIPKEIRARLKHARSAKGLLMDLEKDVRVFVQQWNEREIRLREEGLSDAPLVPGLSGSSLALRPKAEQEKAKRQRAKKNKPSETSETAIVTDDEEDEEIVFVGRNGAMHDMPSSPARSVASIPEGESQHTQSPTRLSAPPRQDMEFGQKKSNVVVPIERDGIIATERCIFESSATDSGAGFARWLVHCVGSYYGLRTWSVTRTVEGESRREAYVGVDSRARGWMAGSSAGQSRCIEIDGERKVELPMPLWGMV